VTDNCRERSQSFIQGDFLLQSYYLACKVEVTHRVLTENTIVPFSRTANHFGEIALLHPGCPHRLVQP